MLVVPKSAGRPKLFIFFRMMCQSVEHKNDVGLIRLLPKTN